ncbi:MAG: polysaccharide deacetylase family protein [Bacillota bacterium]|nr:polysaccharide deacetylase family protein [Bacillota bacterium]
MNKKKFRLLILFLLIINLVLQFKLFREYKAAFAEEKKLPIYNVDRNDKKIALTFDVNWGDNNIDEILDILDKYDIKASFFIIGKWAEENKTEVIKLYERGQEIGNHSYSHKYFSRISKENMRSEIVKCDNVIEKIIGIKPYLFRFPSGEYNNMAVDMAYNTSHFPVQWSVDSIDWKEQGRDIEYYRTVSSTKSGDIILFHTNTKYTPENLPRVIETLKSKGFDIISVSELIYKDSKKTDIFGKQLK